MGKINAALGHKIIIYVSALSFAVYLNMLHVLLRMQRRCGDHVAAC
jgi:hypothetical protein